MTQIWERLFIGGLADAERLAEGNPNGISTVISLCVECVASKRQDVNYLRIPIVDEEPVPLGQFDRIMDALMENIRWGTVLLHCGVGISRAPALTAAYMHVVGYRSIDAALKEVKRRRPFIAPSEILLNSIRRHLK
jgi:protein-tyrosine phosphatase